MAYLALYRAWRPQTFCDIAGQEHVVRTLQHAVESGRTGHAYLFCGSRGTGKTTTAKVLAKALNCLDRQGAEPCNRCANCLAVNDDLSVDVQEIDAASNRGIDEIRELREKVKFAPATGQFRVYIIDEVHMLTNEAFNALLKTLEEPPRHVVFILATTEPRKVPLTILSRCQRFDFKPIAASVIAGRLREVARGAEINIDEEALSIIARAAEGGLRDAISILDQAASFGEMRVTAEDVHNILGTVRADVLSRMAGYLTSGETGPALSLIGELTGLGKDLRLFAQELAAFMRMLILREITPADVRHDIWTEQETTAAMPVQQAGLLRAVEILLKAEQEMKWGSLPGVILELAVVKICRPELTHDLTSLTARIEMLEERIAQIGAPEKAAAIKPAPVMATALISLAGTAGETVLTSSEAPAEGLAGPESSEAPVGTDAEQNAAMSSKPQRRRRLPQAGTDGLAPVSESGSLPIKGIIESPSPGFSGRLHDTTAIAEKGPRTQRLAAGSDKEERRERETAPTATEQDATLAGEPGRQREMEQILKAWPEIINALRRAKPSLYPAFLNAAPLHVTGGVLTVGFPEGDEISLGMAERQDNKEVFSGLLGKFLDSRLLTRYEYYQGEAILPAGRPEPVNDINRRFGGQEVTPPEDYEEEMNLLFDDE